MGLSYLELVVIAEELGRAAARALQLVRVLGDRSSDALRHSEQKRKWLPALAAGEAIGTFALSEGNGRPSVKSLKARLTEAGLSDASCLVADGRAADFGRGRCLDSGDEPVGTWLSWIKTGFLVKQSVR